jgi:tetratricopeptide (TPR) repeat protein
MGPGPFGTQGAARSGATIYVTILDENKKPLKQQALIRLTNQETGRVLFQTTRGSEVNFPELPAGKYLVEVGAVGYLGMHHEISVPDIAHDVHETAILSRDPAAVDLSLKDAAQLPSKARKEAEKGVQALELSNFVEARKHLEAASHQYPSSSSINFLLGYLAMLQKDQDQELGYLTAATKLDPHNVQAQNLLGQLYYQRGDYAHAAEAEEIVVASSGDSLIARKVLANSCLKLKQFEKARENSQWLVDHGGNEGASARLVLGQALAGLQRYEAAIQVLTAYLDEAPASSVTPQVRALLAQLENEVSQGGADAKAKLGIGDPELMAGSESAGSAGMPSDIDAQKPSIAAGVQCPSNILDWTANPSKALVDSVAQFSAIEHMVHENLSPRGTPSNRETRQFNYVASISEPTPGTLIIQEYRDSGDLNMPSKINTTGLPVLAIAFHPHFRDDFEMRCEGLGEWDGQATWLVHFRQLDDKPSRLRAYIVSGNTYPVSLKGRAWIRADNFQIVHLETDLVRAVPEIRLFTEHTSVSYGPVQFKRSSTDLWLPKSAELYVHYGKQRFHRSESFDHFMLFATEAIDTAKLPKGGPSQSPTTDHGATQPQ